MNSQNGPKITKIQVTIPFSCLRYLHLSITDLVAVSFQIQVLFRGCKFHEYIEKLDHHHFKYCFIHLKDILSYS